jgi:hypothetical protein
MFDYNLEVNFNKDEAMDLIQFKVESIIQYNTISIALDLMELNAKFKGNSNNANLLNKEEMINDAEIEGIEREVNEGESATFTTPLPNSIFTLY